MSSRSTCAKVGKITDTTNKWERKKNVPYEVKLKEKEWYAVSERWPGRMAGCLVLAGKINLCKLLQIMK